MCNVIYLYDKFCSTFPWISKPPKVFVKASVIKVGISIFVILKGIRSTKLYLELNRVTQEKGLKWFKLSTYSFRLIRDPERSCLVYFINPTLLSVIG